MYTRPADLREMDYQAFEANTLTGNGTTVLLPAPIKGAHQIHSISIYHSIADAGGTLVIQSEGGLVLWKMALDITGIVHLRWGDFPWGYTIEGEAELQAVIAGTAAVDIAIQGYATS
jgi:hypothetical protein